MRRFRYSAVPRESGVYRLYSGNVCMYVGSSKALRNRLKNHRHLKFCDRFEFDLVPINKLGEEEQRQIDVYDPVLNRARAGQRSDLEPLVLTSPKTVLFSEEDERLIKTIQERLSLMRGNRIHMRTHALRYALRQTVAMLEGSEA